VLHRLSELDAIIRQAANDYDFHRIYSALYNFCVIDLSAFYLDIRKDALYCDARSSLRRRAAMTVLDILHRSLCIWLAPILCFTAEEAWQARFASENGSVHLELFTDIPAAWHDPALARKWQTVRQVRRVATGALEVERREKRIGASLEAHPTIFIADPAVLALMETVDIPELTITSSASLASGEGPAQAFRLEDVPGVAVTSQPAEGRKCERCWQILPEVAAHADHLCHRCETAVSGAARVDA
jgi:isoleucyl-tRNA synthetase